MTLIQALTPAEAQHILDAHPVSAITDRCLCCEVPDCSPRLVALRVLAAQGRLPCRRPGATRPELINARRVSAA